MAGDDAFTIEVVIEIPQGSRNKFEWDEERGVIRLDRRIPSAATFPTHYGFMPGTRSVDGDPLDALVLAEGPLFPGVWMTARPIGVAWVSGAEEPEPKVLCVPDGDPGAESIRDIEDVPTLLLDEIAQFFDVYKLLEPSHTRHLDKWEGRKEANKAVRKARKLARCSERSDDVHQLVEMLCETKTTIAIAESCTGGQVAAAIAATDGAGQCLRGAIVAYDADVKYDALGVTPGAGVINETAATEMALGVRRALGADVGVATTGVVGPDSQEGQPVGTVWVGVACDADDVTAELTDCGDGDPEEVRARAVLQALRIAKSRLSLRANAR